MLRMSPGGDKKRDRVPEGLAENQLIIGWSLAGELGNPDLSKTEFKQYLAHVYRVHEWSAAHAGSSAGNMWLFVREMNPGDVVVVPHFKSFYLAEVDGDAFHVPDKIPEDSAWRRPAKWLNSKQGFSREQASEALRSRMRVRRTCLNISDLADDIEVLLGTANG
jgi:predicted Mrr-cat superfamily restriction endonuclease